MIHRTSLALAFLFASTLVPAAALASPPATDASDEAAMQEEAPRATQVAREGQMMPQTFSATIGRKQVIGVFLGGYDSAPDQGPAFSAMVEGQLFNRVALRVGVDYQDGIHSVYPSVGLRVGILRQER